MFNLRKYYLFIISIIISISFMVSCSKATDPSYESAYKGVVNTTTNTNVMTVYYGSKSKKIVATEENLTKLWREVFAHKKIYSDRAMTTQSGGGRTDEVGNYYENSFSNGNSPRTSLRKVGLTTYQGRPTVCGIYYDNGNRYAFVSYWRKIVVTPDFGEQAWNGPTGTLSEIPDPDKDFNYMHSGYWGFVGD